MKPTLLLIGHGMVGQRFLEAAVEHGLQDTHAIVVVGEEPELAYDRVHLTDAFTSDPGLLALTTREWVEQHGIRFVGGVTVDRLERGSRKAILSSGEVGKYDVAVIATGSAPFVPDIDGRDAPGSFVYRTLADVEAITTYAAGCRSGIVIGGGLLGLEAANALRLLGLPTSVVEFAPRLMPAQLDQRGAQLLQRKIESLGLDVHCNAAAQRVICHAETGAVIGVEFADGTVIETDMVVFSAGIRPRDAIGRASELACGARGGVVIDEACRTADRNVFAIGEVASYDGRCYGLVAPGYLMAEVAAAHISGRNGPIFTGANLDTMLKLVGVDVASFGDAHGATPDCQELVYVDDLLGTYSKLVLSAKANTIIGGVLVGDTTTFGILSEMAKGTVPTPKNPGSLILPASSGERTTLTVADLPEAASVCSCHNITKGAICASIRECGWESVKDVTIATKAGSGCGSCVSMVKDILNVELQAAGKTVSKALCEHFLQSRQELFDLMRMHNIASFSELVNRHGTGRGCEICKPAVASMLASWNPGYILSGEEASLQDTNDHVLANIQRDGTYSVVPRVPGGEITPDKLIVLGEVARDYGLYTKITGGQRVDLFGATIDQLPAIWQRLIDAGFESGHAYGKALRTVKSCVGSTWCRYGVQDAVATAIEIENRYRGLRSPHKLKSAVSGCARECAEAQSKDFGIIATERGYNLYVCGNGGMRPQHAALFAEDLSTEELLTTLDRFLMFYIRTADRLERTATWFNKRDGGIEELRDIILHDSLGICAELEADMARHVERYECEWAAALKDPKRHSRFRSVVGPIGSAQQSGDWMPLIDVADLEPDRGVACKVGDVELAVFKLSGNNCLHVVQNLDPFSGVSVISRGIVGDRCGEAKVSSPMYKQSFSLTSGLCFDDPTVSLDVYPTRVVNGILEVQLVKAIAPEPVSI